MTRSPKQRALSLAVVAALSIAGGSPGTVLAVPLVPDATALMNWAQTTFPAFFPGNLPNLTASPLVYRGPYSNGMFLGVMNNTVYVLGPLTDNNVLAVGSLESFACSVNPVSCDQSTLQIAQSFVASFDAQYAAAVPATGAAATALVDGCYLHDGETKAYSIARFDADPSVRESLIGRVGSTRSQITVLADRASNNPDGSSRRELDIRYKTNYSDGTVSEDSRQTLIYGSSAGATFPSGACLTPDNKTEWRFFGNRKAVASSVTSLNIASRRYSLQTGVPLGSPTSFTRQIRFNVSDPGNVATYATITGPGVRGTYKLISPRLLKTAPEFAGKVGNFVDWDETDTFKACRETTGGNYAEATVADCTTYGAIGNTWSAVNASAASVDSAFDSYGFVAGGRYTVKVYNDDGWKTVNGQATKTPIATYTEVLNRVPYSAVSMAGSGPGSLYADVGSSVAPVQIATVLRTKASGSTNLTINRGATTPDGVKVGWGTIYLFEQGRTAMSTIDNFYPGSRTISYVYPALGATAATLPIVPPPAALMTPTYGEIGVIYNDRNGHSVRTYLTFE